MDNFMKHGENIFDRVLSGVLQTGSSWLEIIGH
jgi:hypothetical protein